ncbi:MAG: CarD family transcriptional regulator [Candidatus Saccharibacteria bacterium]|nr:CarD family transcriptional regulator [Candidatus Saccharibacteria bacterium]
MAHDLHASLEQLFARGQQLTLGKDEIVIRPGDDPSHLYQVQSGYVKVYFINREGEEYLHVIYGAGEIFPLAWIVHRVRRNVFYETITPTVLMRLSRDEFLEHTAHDPEMGFIVMQQVVSQFNIYLDRIDNLEYKYARERLVYRLLFLGSRFGKWDDNGDLVLPYFTQQDLASSINLSRESAVRELNKLKTKKLIDYNTSNIILKDLKALSHEINGGLSPNLWGLLDEELPFED